MSNATLIRKRPRPDTQSTEALIAPTIVPSEENVIKRSDASTNKCEFVLPIYPGIAKDQKVEAWVASSGGFLIEDIVITSETVPARVKVASVVFDGADTVEAYYYVLFSSGEKKSVTTTYTIVD